MSTQEQIDEVIKAIDLAYEPGSVSNEMVGRALGFLNDRTKRISGMETEINQIGEGITTLETLISDETTARAEADTALGNALADLTPSMIIPDSWQILWRDGNYHDQTALRLYTSEKKVKLVSPVLIAATQKGRFDWAIARNIDPFETDWVLPDGHTGSLGQMQYLVMDWTEKKVYGVQFTMLEPFVAGRAGHRLMLMATGPVDIGYGESLTTFGPVVIDDKVLYTPTGREPLRQRANGVVSGAMSFTASESGGTMSYHTLGGDNSYTAKSVSIPCVTDTKAGLMTPAQRNTLTDLTPSMLIPDSWQILWRSGITSPTPLSIDTAKGKVSLACGCLMVFTSLGRFSWEIGANVDAFETQWVCPEGQTGPSGGQTQYLVMDWDEKKVYGVQFSMLESFVAGRAGHKLIQMASGPMEGEFAVSLNVSGPVVIDGMLYTPAASREVEAVPFNLRGMCISILGDSLSAYKGWIPEKNSTWYGWGENGENYQENDIDSVTQLWWYLLCEELGCTLMLNDSYSSSPIANKGYNGADASHMSFVTRAERSFGTQSALSPKPDIVFVFGGLNDQWAGTEHGTYNYTGNYTGDELDQVVPAFCSVLYTIRHHNPGAVVVVLLDSRVSSGLRAKLKSAANHMGAVPVDITASNQNSHYDKAGHLKIKDTIVSVLKGLHIK